MKPENFFLRYAYPCAYIIMQRGEITSSELKELEDIAVHNKDVSKERLEKVFYRAFEFIDKLASKMGKDRWDFSVIKEYFYSDHNRSISEGEGVYGSAPPMLKELSRVDEATVVDVIGDVLKVEFNSKKRNVLNHFVPNAKKGDKVRIHYGYAVEMVE